MPNHLLSSLHFSGEQKRIDELMESIKGEDTCFDFNTILPMFSVPRGFTDGFIMRIKQVIATCLTAFLQSTMLVCGLILFKDHWLLGLGIMLAAGEIPRIAGMFGLETSVRPNINGVINTAQSAVHLKQMVTTVTKK